MILGNAVEAGLHIPAGDSIEGAGEPVPEIALGLVAVEFIGALRAVGIGRHVILEGVAERRHSTRLCALFRWVIAASDLAENLLRQAPGLVRSNFPVTADDDALVGCFPSTIA